MTRRRHGDARLLIPGGGSCSYANKKSGLLAWSYSATKRPRSFSRRVGTRAPNQTGRHAISISGLFSVAERRPSASARSLSAVVPARNGPCRYLAPPRPEPLERLLAGRRPVLELDEFDAPLAELALGDPRLRPPEPRDRHQGRRAGCMATSPARRRWRSSSCGERAAVGASGSTRPSRGRG